jgi:hypothetical protein
MLGMMGIGRPVRAKVLDEFFLSEDESGLEKISQRCDGVKLVMKIETHEW